MDPHNDFVVDIDEVGERYAFLLYRQQETFYSKLGANVREWFEAQLAHYLSEIERLDPAKAFGAKAIPTSQIKDIPGANEKFRLITQLTLDEIIVEGADAANLFLPNPVEVPDGVLQRVAFREAKSMTARVNQTTLKQVRGLVHKLANEQELNINDVQKAIRERFASYSKNRAEITARTETIKTLNQGSIEAWRESGVTKKQWYTTIDGRECEWCPELHLREFALDGTLFKEGEIFVGSEGGTLSFGFGDVVSPPLHPRCRCTLLPVVEV